MSMRAAEHFLISRQAQQRPVAEPHIRPRRDRLERHQHKRLPRDVRGTTLCGHNPQRRRAPRTMSLPGTPREARPILVLPSSRQAAARPNSVAAALQSTHRAAALLGRRWAAKGGSEGRCRGSPPTRSRKSGAPRAPPRKAPPLGRAGYDIVPAPRPNDRARLTQCRYRALHGKRASSRFFRLRGRPPAHAEGHLQHALNSRDRPERHRERRLPRDVRGTTLCRHHDPTTQRPRTMSLPGTPREARLIPALPSSRQAAARPNSVVAALQSATRATALFGRRWDARGGPEGRRRENPPPRQRITLQHMRPGSGCILDSSERHLCPCATTEHSDRPPAPPRADASTKLRSGTERAT
jgi:hypothetical protein